jgi:hypothetical protein
MPATETPTKTEEVSFLARSKDQVLVRRSATLGEDAFGHKMVVGFEQWLEQQEKRNHELKVAGLEPLEIDDTPWRVEFKNFLFKTDHPKLIAWLRSHRLIDFDGPSGFYEADVAVEEQKPTLSEQMAAIIEAQGDFDVEKLQGVLETERETHNRPAIIQAAEAAVRKLAEVPSGSEGDAVPDQGAKPSPSEN